MSILEMKDGIRKGSQGGRRMQSAQQSQKRAVGHKDGLRRHDDGRRVLRVKDRRQLWDTMQNSRRCPSNIQMSSGDERLNGDIQDSSE